MAIGKVVSRTVIIDRDGLGANGYFDKPLRAAKRISFGYGKIISWDFDLSIDPKKIPRLDRVRLPQGVTDPFRRRDRVRLPQGATDPFRRR